MTTSPQAIDLLTQIRDLLREQVRPLDRSASALRRLERLSARRGVSS